VCFHNHPLFAGVSGRGRYDWPPADRVPQGIQGCRVGRWSGDVELEIAGDDDLWRTELSEARGVGSSAGQAKVELAEKVRNRARKAAPASE
jgi:hypothetical protein